MALSYWFKVCSKGNLYYINLNSRMHLYRAGSILNNNFSNRLYETLVFS